MLIFCDENSALVKFKRLFGFREKEIAKKTLFNVRFAIALWQCMYHVQMVMKSNDIINDFIWKMKLMNKKKRTGYKNMSTISVSFIH